MIYNPAKGIYEPEEDPRQYLTGSMAYNHETKIWEPRKDDPNNMYGDNYVSNASQTMRYNQNTMLWEQKTDNNRTANKCNGKKK